MTLEYTIAREDLEQAALLSTRKTWRGVGRGALGMGTLMGLVAWAGEPEMLPVALASLVFAGLLSPMAQRASWTRSAGLVGTIVSLRVTDQGVSYATPDITTRTRWDVYYQWLENEVVFLLYPNSLIHNVVPKRAFTSEQVGEFRRLLTDKIGPAGKARK